eukprot:TRINITY_DN45427_c0_g1_i1.p1 TRINITY_DN45427_c0_g1~~TRINITY_DN45427_c0_g1_i1.p1  ORF type:complete len:383 (-),score=57.00 TRINITY_DN45427_c0_g1_i1:28-1176(-)
MAAADIGVSCQRFGVALSWDHVATSVDVDLQAVAISNEGKVMDAVYYNNMKAFRGGMTHSGDELTGEKSGFDETIWINFAKLPPDVKIIAYVVACYKGGHLCNIPNGKYHLLENSADKETFRTPLESSNEEVDLIGMLLRESEGWCFRPIHSPAADGQHFIDILEPTIGNCVREILPSAPRRLKAAFAMEKGEAIDLPKSSSIQKVFIGLGWDPGQNDIDLDASGILLSGAPGSGRVSDVDVVFFGELTAQGVSHSGDNLTGEGSGDDEVITVDLQAVASTVDQICLVINIYSKGESFGMVKNAYARVFTEGGDELAKYVLSDAGNMNGLVVARVCRAPDGVRWTFQALGMPCAGNTCKDKATLIVVNELCVQSLCNLARQL